MLGTNQPQLPGIPSRGGLSCGLALLGAVSCGQPSDSVVERDLALFVVDALRRDALSCYAPTNGAPQNPITERFDAFAGEALRVENAASPASYTLASTASLFTGLSPARHGTLGLSTNVLPSACRTLAEALSDEGYATAAFSCNPNVSPPGAFDQGFGTFRFHLRDRLDVHVVPDLLLEELAQFWKSEPSSSRARPRFSYVHILPPHAPYDPPLDLLERTGGAETADAEGSHEYLVQLGTRDDLTTGLPQVQRVKARYLAGVQVADRWFGECLDRLEVELDSAMVVLTSDHGESFAEHGRMSHGPSVYAEALEIPLLIRSPDLASGVVPGPVSTQDLAATLTEALGVEWPRDGSGGVSFLSHLRGEALAPRGALLARGTGERPFWSMREDHWMLIAQPTGGYRELYDLASDPKQLKNLAATDPKRAQAFVDRLSEQLASDRARRIERSGPRRHRTLARELAELGYAEGSEDL